MSKFTDSPSGKPVFSPLFTLSLSATLLMIGVGMIVALLPQKVYATTGSLEAVGMIASSFALAYLLAQLPVGIFADLFGIKRFLVIGYALCSLAGLVFVAADTAPMIYLGRAIQGLGEAPIWALGPALLSLAYPDAKGRAIGIYNAAIHGGLTLGPLVGLFVTRSDSDPLPFLIFATLCFGAGVFVLLFLRSNARPRRGNATKGRVQNGLTALWTRYITVILAGILLYGACYGVFVSVLPISLTRTHGFSPTTIAIFFVVFYAAISIAQLTAGPISDRIGRRGFMIWGMGLASIGIAIFPLFPGWLAFIPLAIASAGLGVFCVTSIAELNSRVADEFKGTISGSYYFFWATGYMLGPICIGWTTTAFPTASFLLLSVLLALFAAGIAAIRE